MSILLITLLIMKFRNWKQRRQLLWQQSLLTKGVGLRTKLLQVLEDSRLYNGYKRIQIIAAIRINGKKVKYKMHTWIKPGEAPHAGEKVMIRYQPGIHHVLVKQFAA